MQLLTLVSDAYTHHDEDRDLLIRSLEISSKEFSESSHQLNLAKSKIEEQAKNLSIQVIARTEELNKRVVELENTRTTLTNLLKDFEEEKKKKESLANDLEKFKLAVDNASDAIVITDPEGIIVYANRGVEKITGYGIDEAVGKKSGVLWKFPMPVGYYQKMWDTIKNQKKPFLLKYKINGKMEKCTALKLLSRPF